MKNRVAAFVLSLMAAAGLWAHGGMEHITGVVKSVSAQSLVVETLKHETVTVRLTAKTEAMKSGVKAELKSLKPGERVAIHAVKDKSGAFEAHEVEWGPTPQSKK
jgi:Cu/Ag efflux protein CusF